MTPLEPASTQYNDLVGTVAIETSPDDVWLERTAGLDQNDWLIIGFEIYNTWASFYALDRRIAANFEEAAALERERGKLPLTRFRVDDEDAVRRLMEQGFSRFSLVATRKSWKDFEFEIENAPEENG